MRINPGTTVPNDVQSSVQIANDLGEQVVNLVPTTPVPARHSRAVPACRPTRIRSLPTSVPSWRRPPACSRPSRRDDLNKLIGELATSLSGQAGNLRTLISAGTTFSKEFVAYQQQFTELLANAPPSLDAITAVAPRAPSGPGQHGRAGPGAGRTEDGSAHAAHVGSTAFNPVDNLLTSQSANLGCFLHDTPPSSPISPSPRT